MSAISIVSSELCWPHPQAWKNATLAEQAKLPTTEKPVLLSKDIEAKMMALDREVQYLLNKAKFAKPRPKPKDKNETRAEPPLNASANDQGERVIPPPGEAGYVAPGAAGQKKVFPSGITFLLLVFLQTRLKMQSPFQNLRKRFVSWGKLGIWTSLSLGVGKRAGTAWFWTAMRLLKKKNAETECGLQILKYVLSLQKKLANHCFSPFFLSADTKLFLPLAGGSEPADTGPLELEGSGAGEDGVGGSRKLSRVWGKYLHRTGVSDLYFICCCSFVSPTPNRI